MIGNIKENFLLSLILPAALLFLVFCNISCKDTSDEQRVPLKDHNVSISAGVDSILYSFAFKKSWIKNKNSKDSTLLFSKEIQVPNDVPLIELNYEITGFLEKNGFDSKVTEEIKSGNLTMSVHLAGETLKREVANLRLAYSDSAKRSASLVCIVLDSIESSGLPEVEKILNSTQQFSVLLPLRNDKAEYQSEIIESKRSYLVAVSIGNEDDIEADLKDGMTQDALKTKIRSLSLNFAECNGFILNNRNASDDFLRLVKEEFTQNNLTVYDESIFDQFKPAAGSKVISLFENIILKTAEGKKYLIYRLRFTPDEFNDFDRQVYNMKKLGYKFLNFRDFMRRKNNIQPGKNGNKNDSLVKAK